MNARVLLLAFAVGCSASTARVAATAREPVRCCCTHGDCRERFTQKECASEGEFQGWTYKRVSDAVSNAPQQKQGILRMRADYSLNVILI